MTTWTEAARAALTSGSAASALSTAVLAGLGRRQSGSAVAPINAISHWYWGDGAAQVEQVDAKHTLAGYLTHHVASVFWAVFFEKWFGERARSNAPTADRDALIGGALTATLAAAVDYTITPHRFTPGYELRLKWTSLVWVYGAVALGLALTARAQRPARHDDAMHYGAPLY
jgi:hypothetical protein